MYFPKYSALVSLISVWLCLFRDIQSNIPSWLEMPVMRIHWTSQTVSEVAVRVLYTTVGGRMTTATLLIQAISHSPGWLMMGIQYLSPKLVCPAPDPA